MLGFRSEYKKQRKNKNDDASKKGLLLVTPHHCCSEHRNMISRYPMRLSQYILTAVRSQYVVVGTHYSRSKGMKSG